ncbi:unnamed protein product [Sphagnum balticum]
MSRVSAELDADTIVSHFNQSYHPRRRNSSSTGTSSPGRSLASSGVQATPDDKIKSMRATLSPRLSWDNAVYSWVGWCDSSSGIPDNRRTKRSPEIYNLEVVRIVGWYQYWWCRCRLSFAKLLSHPRTFTIPMGHFYGRFNRPSSQGCYNCTKC